jgi:hypothetical protein
VDAGDAVRLWTLDFRLVPSEGRMLTQEMPRRAEGTIGLIAERRWAREQQVAGGNHWGRGRRQRPPPCLKPTTNPRFEVKGSVIMGEAAHENA